VTDQHAERRAPAKPPARSTTRPSPGEDWTQWPTYNAATLGFRNYWYPVVWERDIGDKPQAVTLLGEKIMVAREGDKIYALKDRCGASRCPTAAASSPAR